MNLENHLIDLSESNIMDNFKKIIPILFLCLIFQQSYGNNDVCTITIVTQKNRRIKLNIEIADTMDDRLRGLMFRKYLPENQGMLFIFDETEKRSFWMKNTYLPLSIAYISRNGIINEIYHMRPLDTSVTYPSIYPARYVLEVNKGWFKKNNIKKGSKLLLHGCLSK